MKLEFTRAEQFYGATTRHPFTVTVKAGARRDGTLTALQLRVVANTGAYGNHGPAVMFHSVGESMAVYRAPHKKVDAFSRLHQRRPGRAPSAATASARSPSPSSRAMDELARRLGIDPLVLRERNIIGPGEPMVSPGGEEEDLHIASYGLDQCLSVIRRRPRRGPQRRRTRPRGWLVGRGRGHVDDRHRPARRPLRRRHASRLLPDGSYDIAVGTAEFGNGTTTVPPADRRRRAAAPPPTGSPSASPTPTSSGTTPAPSAPPAPSWRARPC